jgi:hypothetical protein
MIVGISIDGDYCRERWYGPRMRHKTDDIDGFQLSRVMKIMFSGCLLPTNVDNLRPGSHEVGMILQGHGLYMMGGETVELDTCPC